MDRREYYRQYAAKNAASIRARRNEWQKRNHEKVSAYQRAWRKKHHAQHLANKRAWYEKQRAAAGLPQSLPIKGMRRAVQILNRALHNGTIKVVVRRDGTLTFRLTTKGKARVQDKVRDFYARSA